MIADQGFTNEQQNYLLGFLAGSEAARAARGMPTFAATLGLASPSGEMPASQPAAPIGPEAIHFEAQNRFRAAGQKLCPEEEAKRAKNPLDMWDELRAHAEGGTFPKGTDVLLFKFQGLFYVAPAQNAFMCRLRFAGGIVKAFQLSAVADIAERWAGAYADVTTRANLQLREIGPKDTISVLTALQEAGIVIRGSGADNIRNITGSPTAGIDPQELIDTRPLTSELHHHILNHRELYGLPRKFNIAYDGGGSISVLEDTNDIGFAAVRVEKGKGVPAGVYFRVLLGGITGHGDFARDTGLLLAPFECLPVAVAMVRVFIEHGDRTDRKKARLKYLLDRWGFEKFLEEAQKRLSIPLRRLPLDQCEPRRPSAEQTHIGFHPQRQTGLWYAGVVLPVGRLTVEQLRGLAEIADRWGSGTIRLTVWQNLLISDIATADIPEVKRRIEALGLDWQASNLRGSLVACTGNSGCKFAAANTKRHALELIEYLESRVPLDVPINIHLTGCQHSCAQHYIGDIGLLATKVAVGGEMVEGYHVYLGGGFGSQQVIGHEVQRDVPVNELLPLVERLLLGYLQERREGEGFGEFSRRLTHEELQRLAQGQPQLLTV